MAVDFRDPFVQRSVLVGLGLAGLLYVFFGTHMLPVCCRPQAERIREARDEVERLSDDLSRAKQTASGLKALQDEYARLEKDWEEARALMPAKSEIPDFLTGVTRSGLDCGLQILMFEPKKLVQHAFYTESPVAVKVAGQYHQVGDFLARVASLPRLVNISQLQLRERTGTDGEDQTVEAEMILSAYYLDDRPAAPPAEN